MRASGSAYQPLMTGLPALVLVLDMLMSRGDWRAVAVVRSIRHRKCMMRYCRVKEE